MERHYLTLKVDIHITSITVKIYLNNKINVIPSDITNLCAQQLFAYMFLRICYRRKLWVIWLKPYLSHFNNVYSNWCPTFEMWMVRFCANVKVKKTQLSLI